MTHASLFSGIGGFDLAAEWMGWQNVFNCEIDPWCRRVLFKHFPLATQYEDIKSTDFTIWRGAIDILTGGFPCQPYSHAGKRLGSADDRHLWPEMLRAIREIRPRYVVGENVGGLLSWNEGVVFEQVLADLEGEGYEVQTFVIPACGVNAPHKRDRVWIVAHRSDAGTQSVRRSGKDSIYGPLAIANPNRQGLKSRICGELGCVQTSPTASTRCKSTRTYTANRWAQFPTQSPIYPGNDGLSARLDRLRREHRARTVKGAGNAIVPQVAYQIFQAISATIKYFNSKWKTPPPARKAA